MITNPLGLISLGTFIIDGKRVHGWACICDGGFVRLCGKHGDNSCLCSFDYLPCPACKGRERIFDPACGCSVCCGVSEAQKRLVLA